MGWKRHSMIFYYLSVYTVHLFIWRIGAVLLLNSDLYAEMGNMCMCEFIIVVFISRKCNATLAHRSQPAMAARSRHRPS
jgi:hypothetical protein